MVNVVVLLVTSVSSFPTYNHNQMSAKQVAANLETSSDVLSGWLPCNTDTPIENEDYEMMVTGDWEGEKHVKNVSQSELLEYYYRVQATNVPQTSNNKDIMRNKFQQVASEFSQSYGVPEYDYDSVRNDISKLPLCKLQMQVDRRAHPQDDNTVRTSGKSPLTSRKRHIRRSGQRPDNHTSSKPSLTNNESGNHKQPFSSSQKLDPDNTHQYTLKSKNDIVSKCQDVTNGNCDDKEQNGFGVNGEQESDGTKANQFEEYNGDTMIGQEISNEVPNVVQHDVNGNEIETFLKEDNGANVYDKAVSENIITVTKTSDVEEQGKTETENGGFNLEQLEGTLSKILGIQKNAPDFKEEVEGGNRKQGMGGVASIVESHNIMHIECNRCRSNEENTHKVEEQEDTGTSGVLKKSSDIEELKESSYKEQNVITNFAQGGYDGDNEFYFQDINKSDYLDPEGAGTENEAIIYEAPNVIDQGINESYILDSIVIEVAPSYKDQVEDEFETMGIIENASDFKDKEHNVFNEEFYNENKPFDFEVQNYVGMLNEVPCFENQDGNANSIEIAIEEHGVPQSENIRSAEIASDFEDKGLSVGDKFGIAKDIFDFKDQEDNGSENPAIVSKESYFEDKKANANYIYIDLEEHKVGKSKNISGLTFDFDFTDKEQSVRDMFDITENLLDFEDKEYDGNHRVVVTDQVPNSDAREGNANYIEFSNEEQEAAQSDNISGATDDSVFTDKEGSISDKFGITENLLDFEGMEDDGNEQVAVMDQLPYIDAQEGNTNDFAHVVEDPERVKNDFIATIKDVSELTDKLRSLSYKLYTLHNLMDDREDTEDDGNEQQAVFDQVQYFEENDGNVNVFKRLVKEQEWVQSENIAGIKYSSDVIEKLRSIKERFYIIKNLLDCKDKEDYGNEQQAVFDPVQYFEEEEGNANRVKRIVEYQEIIQSDIIGVIKDASEYRDKLLSLRYRLYNIMKNLKDREATEDDVNEQQAVFDQAQYPEENYVNGFERDVKKQEMAQSDNIGSMKDASEFTDKLRSLTYKLDIMNNLMDREGTEGDGHEQITVLDQVPTFEQQEENVNDFERIELVVKEQEIGQTDNIGGTEDAIDLTDKELSVRDKLGDTEYLMDFEECDGDDCETRDIVDEVPWFEESEGNANDEVSVMELPLFFNEVEVEQRLLLIPNVYDM